MPARIVIVEDECLIRDYLERVCTEAMGMTVVGLAANREAAIRLLQEQRPDLALVDLRLEWEGGTGFEVADWARVVMPQLRILFISGYDSTETMRKVEQARVCGFVEKSLSATAELVLALRTVAAGRTYFSQSYFRALTRRQCDPMAYDRILSDRERDVLELIANGMSDAEIAALLGLTPRTVETHRHRILRKLDLNSTPKLMKFAIDHGYTDFGGPGLPAPSCMA